VGGQCAYEQHKNFKKIIWGFGALACLGHSAPTDMHLNIYCTHCWFAVGECSCGSDAMLYVVTDILHYICFFFL